MNRELREAISWGECKQKLPNYKNFACYELGATVKLETIPDASKVNENLPWAIVAVSATKIREAEETEPTEDTQESSPMSKEAIRPFKDSHRSERPPLKSVLDWLQKNKQEARSAAVEFRCAFCKEDWIMTVDDIKQDEEVECLFRNHSILCQKAYREIALKAETLGTQISDGWTMDELSHCVPEFDVGYATIVGAYKKGRYENDFVVRAKKFKLYVKHNDQMNEDDDVEDDGDEEDDIEEEDEDSHDEMTQKY